MVSGSQANGQTKQVKANGQSRGLQWLEKIPLVEQEQAVSDHLQILFQDASQPKQESGNACLKLCYFTECCSQSGSINVKQIAFSYRTCLALFVFYIESNEKNQHRSMRQVLELLAKLIIQNPDKEQSGTIKSEILDRAISSISHASAQAFVKPSLKALECFLGKKAVSAREIIAAHGKTAFFRKSWASPAGDTPSELLVLDSFVAATFDWMSLPDTAPSAGKLLLTIFHSLKNNLQAVSEHVEITAASLWHRWLRLGLTTHPESIENVKNHIFPQLFRADRAGSIQFLESLTSQSDLVALHGRKVSRDDTEAFLLLSALEAARKAGLVDEPDILLRESHGKPPSCIALPEAAIGELLGHQLSQVRSAAFSVLVSSVASTRPFSSYTLDLLKQNLHILHADTDAKIRNETSSNVQHMLERMRGAISVLSRESSGHSTQRRKVEIAALDAESKFDNTKEGIEISLDCHKAFLAWYIQFLSNELLPTASYQRHIAALKVLQILLRLKAHRGGTGAEKRSSGVVEVVWPYPILFFTRKLVRLLLDLVMDPFEDVRAAATEILKASPPENFISHLSDVCISSELPDQQSNVSTSRPPTVLPGKPTFHQRIQKALQRTGRADIADGVARTSDLLCSYLRPGPEMLLYVESLILDLEAKVLVAEADLAEAVLKAPIHGDFASLRMVWDTLCHSALRSEQDSPSAATSEQSRRLELDGLQHRILQCCTRIWTAVEEVLCNDSPEGHLPTDVEEMDVIDTKDILSYSFRAIHESSNLLAVIVNKLKLMHTDGAPLLPFDIFRDAGQLTFQQLTTLRHRGAFSTVSLTFAKCCRLAQDISVENPVGLALLHEWYQGAVACVYDQVSTTRRSAGIPALMTGILSANPSSPSFDEVMVELQTIAKRPVVTSDRDETHLPQVHAMNCLKEIFKSSTLGRKRERYIPNCLQLAATSLKSKTWAIRNCGLLMLRSLIDCLFGTSESKAIIESGWDGKSIKVAYEKYADLPQLLLDLMSSPADVSISKTSLEIGSVESVFPALDIIRRAGPPPGFEKEVFTPVAAHLGSKAWHVRDIAARTMCTLLLRDGWLQELEGLLSNCGQGANEAHGVLLACKYVVERRYELFASSLSDDLPHFTDLVLDFYSKQSPRCTSPYVEAAFDELAAVVLKVAFLQCSGDQKASQSPAHPDWAIRFFDDSVFDRTIALLQGNATHILKNSVTDAKNISGQQGIAALWNKAAALRSVYTAAIRSQVHRIGDIVRDAAQHDAETASVVLDVIPTIFGVGASCTHGAWTLELYNTALSHSRDGQVRDVALRNMAAALDKSLTARKARELGSFHYDPTLVSSPNTTNAEIRAMGSLLAFRFARDGRDINIVLMEKQNVQLVSAWNHVIAAAASCDNDFDTRLAAIESLHSFWNAKPIALTGRINEVLLPSILNVYDMLNDDDDEIRDLAAFAAAAVTETSAVPMAVSHALLLYAQDLWGEQECFSKAVASRLVGHDVSKPDALQSAQSLVSRAAENDEALFLEEEQNLYIDKVKEVLVWSTFLEKGSGPAWEGLMQRLSTWAMEGLEMLCEQAKQLDGPYGWSSKAGMFATCVQIIATAVALSERSQRNTLGLQVTRVGADVVPSTEDMHEFGGGPSLLSAIDTLHRLGQENDLHPVLLDLLGSVNTSVA